MGEGKRHEMMETLFGAESDGSEGEDQNEDFQRGAAPAYSDDEAEGGGEVEAESEAEKEESEAKRAESDEAEREESDANHSSSEGNQSGHQRRYAASERRGGRQQGSASGSEQSHETGCLEDEDEEAEAAHFHKARGVEEEDDEVEQAPEPSEEAYDDGRASGGVAEMRDVFGDSDEEEQELDDGGQHSPQAGAEASASGDEASVQRGIRPDDVVPDEERHEDAYDSENEHPAERRARERPVGTPLHIDIPFCPPPGHPDKMHVVRVSNIMGIESRPFNPKTYVEVEEQFVMDESGHKQRIRLEDNVARWRLAHNHDGRPKYESNARFVKWSDGSMQLLIGNEVLDISVQKAHQDQAHLFLRHGKGILQSQGRLLQKMKFMPSSLSSKSHRLLTALVDSRNRKIYKVKNVITNKDPEREKEETEKMQEKRIRSKEDLQRKQEKITRKYLPVRERVEPQLSPGYLEGALEEDDVDDYPQGQRAVDFKDQLEAEGRAERRIMNAKRHPAASRDSMDKRTKDRQTSLPPEESEPEASEYESEGQDEYEQENEIDEEEEQQEEVDEEVEEDNEDKERWDDEDEAIKKRKDREDDSDHEASPPRKFVQRRRVVVSDSDED